MNVEINKTLGSPHTSVVFDSMAEVGWGELGQDGIGSLGRELEYLCVVLGSSEATGKVSNGEGKAIDEESRDMGGRNTKGKMSKVNIWTKISRMRKRNLCYFLKCNSALHTLSKSEQLEILHFHVFPFLLFLIYLCFFFFVLFFFFPFSAKVQNGD